MEKTTELYKYAGFPSGPCWKEPTVLLSRMNVMSEFPSGLLGDPVRMHITYTADPVNVAEADSNGPLGRKVVSCQVWLKTSEEFKCASQSWQDGPKLQNEGGLYCM